MFWCIMQKNWADLLVLEKKVLSQLFKREHWLNKNEWYVNTDKWTIWDNIWSWNSAKYRDDLLHIWRYKSIDLESSKKRWIFQFSNSTRKYFSIKYYKFFDNVYLYWIQEIITRCKNECLQNNDVLKLVDNDKNIITEIFERILQDYQKNNEEKSTFYYFILKLMNLILSDHYCKKFWIYHLNDKYYFDQQKNKKQVFNKFLIMLYTLYQDFFKEKHNNKLFEKEIMYHSNEINENNKIQFTRIKLNTLDIATNDVNQLYIDLSRVMNKDNSLNKNIYLRFPITEEQMKNYEYVI